MRPGAIIRLDDARRHFCTENDFLDIIFMLTASSWLMLTQIAIIA